jgi:hypothetical protein
MTLMALLTIFRPDEDFIDFCHPLSRPLTIQLLSDGWSVTQTAEEADQQ